MREFNSQQKAEKVLQVIREAGKIGRSQLLYRVHRLLDSGGLDQAIQALKKHRDIEESLAKTATGYRKEYRISPSKRNIVPHNAPGIGSPRSDTWIDFPRIAPGSSATEIKPTRDLEDVPAREKLEEGWCYVPDPLTGELKQVRCDEEGNPLGEVQR